MRNSILVLFLLHLAFSGFSQGLVYGILPISQTIKSAEINEVKTISDMNPVFPSSWIREYVLVDLSINCNGEIFTASGSDSTLNKDQLDILSMASTRSDIMVAIQYYPNNDLPKELKEMDFIISIAPDINAEYQEGSEQMHKYLKKNVIDRLSVVSDMEIHEAIMRFDVSANGEIQKAKIVHKSHSDEIDQLLLNAIRKMTKWNPAKNNDGTLVSQAFEFIVTRDACANSGLYADN